MSSLPRQNYSHEVEAGINKQINIELTASSVYQSMAYYFDRDDVALPGFFKFFKDRSDEERAHAHRLMKYQNERGGRIVSKDVAKPEKDVWDSGLVAMQRSLGIEKMVNVSLLELHKLGEQNTDPHVCNFLESEYLTEQVDDIKKLSDYVTMLKRAGPGLGEYLFDKETLG